MHPGSRLLGSLFRNPAPDGSCCPAGKPCDAVNRLVVFVFAVTAGLSSNLDTIILNLSLLWIAYQVLSGRLRFVLASGDVPVAAMVLLYPVVMIVAVWAKPNAMEGLTWIKRVVPFLGLFLLVARLRLSPGLQLWRLFLAGCGLGTICSFVLAGIQVGWFLPRAEGGTTNAALFGLVGVLFGGLSLLNASSPDRFQRWIAFLGYSAGLGCAFLSGTRSAWAVIPIQLFVFIWYFGCSSLSVRRGKVLVVSAAIIAAMLVTTAPLIWHRVDKLRQEVTLFSDDSDAFSSFSARMALYRGAVSAIRRSPLTGFGPQNRMTAVLREIDGRIKDKLTFTHVHNGFLTAQVDAGVPGLLGLVLLLAAPVVAARRAAPRQDRTMATAVSLLLVSSYVVTGSFGIMFGHRVVDTTYAYITALVISFSGQPRAAGAAIDPDRSGSAARRGRDDQTMAG
jgi:O-antigen ligase